MNTQRLTIFTLFFVILVDAIGWGIAFPVLAPVILNNSSHLLSATSSVHFRNELYELLLAVYCFGMFLMSPILGSLADRYGRKLVLTISMLGNCLGYLVGGLGIMLPSLLIIILGRALAGLTAGSLPIAQAAMIDISEEEKKSARLGLAVLGNVLGFAIGPTIGGIFMDHHLLSYASYQLPFFVSSGIGLLGTLMVLVFFKETFKGDKSVKVNVTACVQYVKEAFTNAKLRALCLTIAFFMLAWGMYFSSMPVMMTDRFHWNGSQISYFIAYIAIVFALIVTVIMQRILKAFSLPKLGIVCLGILAVSSLLFAFNYIPVFTWFIFLLTSVVPIGYVSLITLLSKQVDSNQQGRVMGVVGSVFALMWALGPTLSGYLLSLSLTFNFIMVAVSLFIAMMIFHSFKKSHHLE